MVWLFVLSVVAVAIVFLAVRIVLGWVLPEGTMAAIDRAVDRIMKVSLQIIVVLFGVAIMAFVFFVVKG